eukprot:7381652-Prymnesium_polylepis.2
MAEVSLARCKHHRLKRTQAHTRSFNRGAVHSRRAPQAPLTHYDKHARCGWRRSAGPTQHVLSDT